jgi:phosphoglycerate-specific signal transduction histidine kinase
MCQSCVEIDKRIEQYRESQRSTADPAEIERINRLIAQLYRDRVLLHQNPER